MRVAVDKTRIKRIRHEEILLVLVSAVFFAFGVGLLLFAVAGKTALLIARVAGSAFFLLAGIGSLVLAFVRMQQYSRASMYGRLAGRDGLLETESLAEKTGFSERSVSGDIRFLCGGIRCFVPVPDGAEISAEPESLTAVRCPGCNATVRVSAVRGGTCAYCGVFVSVPHGNT